MIPRYFFSLLLCLQRSFCCVLLLMMWSLSSTVMAAAITLLQADGRNIAVYATIQEAVDAAKPGDTVRIEPGVYFEHVQVRVRGTAQKPITIKADRIAKNRVIITGADSIVRTGKIKWQPDDRMQGLYWIAWDKPRPTRVLYSGADLYPYKSLENLLQFMAVIDEKRPSSGPRHGYVLDEQEHRIYLRLHPSGKYGSTDPNEHTMCISGPLGQDEVVGLEVTEPSHYNIGILGLSDAHIVIEGLTFETPGITGLYTQSNDVLVRDCWFVGCRSGVGGTVPYFRPENMSYEKTANRVTVEHCQFTQFPVYDDGCETMAIDKRFWQRKDISGGLPDWRMNYEVGITSLMGKDWVVRRNHVHNAFEALSSRSTTNSLNARIEENLFEKLLDNAVETEDHARDIHINRNVIRDTFVPLSWQPLEGEPWPGPVYCYQNIIYNSPEHDSLFAFRKPPIFKIGATSARKQYGKDYLPHVADPGLLFFNNTAIWPNGCVFWGAIWGNNPDQVKFYNNILIADFKFPNKWMSRAPFLTFVNNLCVTHPMEGLEGQWLPESQLLKLADVARYQCMPLPDSPATGKALPIPSTVFAFRNIGALESDATWYPLTVGPRTELQTQP